MAIERWDRTRETWMEHVPITGVIMLSFKWMCTKSNWLHSLSIPFFFRKMFGVMQTEYKAIVGKDWEVVNWMECQAVVMNETKWSVSFHKSFALGWHKYYGFVAVNRCFTTLKTGFHKPNQSSHDSRWTLAFFFLRPFYHWKNFQLICIIIELSR